MLFTNSLQMKKRPEIMAPVGSFESLAAAINAGCDSIFFGVTQLNMRARSSHNFTLDELDEVANKCRLANVSAYVTMNTLLYEHDLNLMKKILDRARESRIDAVIIQDVAAMQYAREIGLSVHASTQLSISNYEAVKFYATFADTVVLAREVDIPMMKSICAKIAADDLRGPAGKLIEVEVFVHGALCIAQSGRCQMSLLQNNTSAQRGACLQECRKSYKVIDEETGKEMRIRDGFILSPRDLCCLLFLDELADAGVSIFKIEGRGRSAHYVDTVVRVYREAADSLCNGSFGTPEKMKQWQSDLKMVYNRGFTDGYYLGKKLPDFSNYSGNKAGDERVFVGIVNHYYPNPRVVEIDVQAHEIKKNDRLVVMGKTTGVVKENVGEIMLDGVFVENSGKKVIVTIPFAAKVRKNDKVYLLRERKVYA